MIYLFTTNADKSYNISDRSISKLISLLAPRLVINLYNVTKQQASKDYFREIEVLTKIYLASLILKQLRPITVNCIFLRTITWVTKDFESFHN